MCEFVWPDWVAWTDISRRSSSTNLAPIYRKLAVSTFCLIQRQELNGAFDLLFGVRRWHANFCAPDAHELIRIFEWQRLLEWCMWLRWFRLKASFKNKEHLCLWYVPSSSTRQLAEKHVLQTLLSNSNLNCWWSISEIGYAVTWVKIWKFCYFVSWQQLKYIFSCIQNIQYYVILGKRQDKVPTTLCTSTSSRFNYLFPLMSHTLAPIHHHIT